MPFTTSHPAIVLPLKKIFPRLFSLTGLMAGAMSPDLLYFLNLSTLHRSFSHSWSGLFVFCLPAGVIFSFAFHWFFKYHFLSNLPFHLDHFFSGLTESEFKPRGVKSWLILLISVLIGALSHFFWDSFTHKAGMIAQLIPFLTQYTVIFNIRMLNTTILQHLSTLGGLIFMIIFFWKGKLLPSPPANFQPRKTIDKLKFWSGTISFAIVFALVIISYYHHFYPRYPISDMVIIGLATWSGFFYAVVGHDIYQKIIKQMKKKQIMID